MLNKIKKELLSHPDKLKEVLEHYGYCNIVIRSTYMSFGRDEYSSKKSIVVKLENNDYLWVTDYARNINKELFTYISEQRNVEFINILNTVKSVLGITDYYDYFNNNKRGIFGGFYEKIKHKNITKIQTYDKSVLDVYENVCNTRFLKDNISLEAQRFFNIRYDIESQGIVIPIYDQFGQLMGAKTRCNYHVEDGELKYYYLIPCMCSRTLYGFFQNYNYLVNNTIFVFESEKSVMQCYSYGIRNCVALGSGSISQQQVQLLLQLQPKKIIFMHDQGYKMEYIQRNIDIVKNYSRFSEVEIGYWDYFNKNYEDKVSPSDLGKDKLNYIINNEIKMIGEIDDEEI